MSGGEPGADSLAADAVAPLLRGGFGTPYRYEPECASTQALLDTSLPEGAVAVCDRQAAGRGRLGRSWETPAGTAILCSVLLRPGAERRAAELSLVGGVATALAVEDALGRPSQIKWPNDVLVNGSKVAGVLAERRDGVVVLGIGLNVNQRPEELPADTKIPAASLYTVDGVNRRRAPLLAALLAHLEHAYARWEVGGDRRAPRRAFGRATFSATAASPWTASAAWPSASTAAAGSRSRSPASGGSSRAGRSASSGRGRRSSGRSRRRPGRRR